MTRLMGDSTGGQSQNIPGDVDLVAGYIDGPYAWTDENWARFPSARHVTISVEGNPADVADVENGALTIQDAIALRYGTVYCAESNWAANQAACQAAGYAPQWWVAAYPGIGAELYPGSVAHQYESSGGWDASVVADYWPGVDPSPKPPAPTDEETELLTFDLAASASRWVPGPDQNTDWNAVAANGDTTIEVIAYSTSGAPLHSTGPLPLSANDPDVSGPNQQYGSAAQLGATGACTLGFVAGSGGPVTISIHGL